MKKFIEKYFFVFFFITVLVFIVLGTVIVYKVFTVKNIVVEKNFNVDDYDIVDYLNIEENTLIWSYDTSLLENRLSQLDYFYKYSITKKYPDTLIIEIKVRTPIATISDENGNISFIDTNNVIFQRYSVDTLLPLIVYNGENLFEAANESKDTRVVNDLVKNVVKILSNLNVINKDIFDNISQIEVIESGDELLYSLSFRGVRGRVYLQNYINLNLIADAFISSLFLSESGVDNRNVYYTGTGFVY